MARRSTRRAPPPVEISEQRYNQTLKDTFHILEMAGHSDLSKFALAISGVESNFGSVALLRGERRQIDRYTGIFQLGVEHSRYLGQTPQADELRERALMPEGEVLPARAPYDPYKNQATLGAAMIMHYADLAMKATGKEPAELTARDVWTPHLFGQNGGIALMKAAHSTPDMLLSELTFTYHGQEYPAVRRAAYNANIGPGIPTINSEGIPYETITVGQAYDMVQRHFDRKAAQLPAGLEAQSRKTFLIAIRPEQPKGGEHAENALVESARIEQLQQSRITAARDRLAPDASRDPVIYLASAGTLAPLPPIRPEELMHVVDALPPPPARDTAAEPAPAADTPLTDPKPAAQAAITPLPAGQEALSVQPSELGCLSPLKLPPPPSSDGPATRPTTVAAKHL